MEKEMLEKLKAYYLGICRIFERAEKTENRTYQESKAVLELVENRERYRWHDLRKNPEDLPSDDCEDDFFTVAVNGTDEDGHKCGGYVMTATYLYDGTWDVCDTLKVIA